MATKVDITSEDGLRFVQQIDDNVERMRSLAEAENEAGMAELASETEGLISSLSGKGSVAAKKEKRAALKEAAEGTPKPTPAPTVEVELLETQNYKDIPGAEKMVAKGAKQYAEGVRLNLRASEVSREIAETLLEIHSTMSNKFGDPDLMGSSQGARDATSDLITQAGELFRAQTDADERDVAEAMDRLLRSQQNWKSDVRAAFARSLNDNPERAERFGRIISARSEGVTPAEAVAAHYGFALKGRRELDRENRQRRKELRAKRELGETLTDEELRFIGEAPEAPAEHVANVVERTTKDLRRTVKAVKKADDEATRADVANKLDAAIAELAKLRAQL
jgi:hypothetical protein